MQNLHIFVIAECTEVGPNTSLSIASDNFPAMIRQIYDSSAKLTKHVELEEEKGNILKDEEGKTIGSRRKQLRQKFYSQEGLSHREQNVSNFSIRRACLQGFGFSEK